MIFAILHKLCDVMVVIGVVIKHIYRWTVPKSRKSLGVAASIKQVFSIVFRNVETCSHRSLAAKLVKSSRLVSGDCDILVTVSVLPTSQNLALQKVISGHHHLNLQLLIDRH